MTFKEAAKRCRARGHRSGKSFFGCVRGLGAVGGHVGRKRKRRGRKLGAIFGLGGGRTAQQRKLAAAAKSCKGRPREAFRRCMMSKL